MLVRDYIVRYWSMSKSMETFDQYDFIECWMKLKLQRFSLKKMYPEVVFRGLSTVWAEVNISQDDVMTRNAVRITGPLWGEPYTYLLPYSDVKWASWSLKPPTELLVFNNSVCRLATKKPSRACINGHWRRNSSVPAGFPNKGAVM